MAAVPGHLPPLESVQRSGEPHRIYCTSGGGPCRRNRVLVNRELAARIPRTRGVLAGQLPVKIQRTPARRTAEWVGDRSRLWVALLEQLTCIDRLDV